MKMEQAWIGFVAAADDDDDDDDLHSLANSSSFFLIFCWPCMTVHLNIFIY